MGAYRLEGLDGLLALVCKHAKEEDGEVVDGRGERARHERHGL